MRKMKEVAIVTQNRGDSSEKGKKGVCGNFESFLSLNKPFLSRKISKNQNITPVNNINIINNIFVHPRSPNPVKKKFDSFDERGKIMNDQQLNEKPLDKLLVDLLTRDLEYITNLEGISKSKKKQFSPFLNLLLKKSQNVIKEKEHSFSPDFSEKRKSPNTKSKSVRTSYKYLHKRGQKEASPSNMSKNIFERENFGLTPSSTVYNYRQISERSQTPQLFHSHLKAVKRRNEKAHETIEKHDSIESPSENKKIKMKSKFVACESERIGNNPEIERAQTETPNQGRISSIYPQFSAEKLENPSITRGINTDNSIPNQFSHQISISQDEENLNSKHMEERDKIISTINESEHMGEINNGGGDYMMGFSGWEKGRMVEDFDSLYFDKRDRNDKKVDVSIVDINRIPFNARKGSLQYRSRTPMKLSRDRSGEKLKRGKSNRTFCDYGRGRGPLFNTNTKPPHPQIPTQIPIQLQSSNTNTLSTEHNACTNLRTNTRKYETAREKIEEPGYSAEIRRYLLPKGKMNLKDAYTSPPLQTMSPNDNSNINNSNMKEREENGGVAYCKRPQTAIGNVGTGTGGGQKCVISNIFNHNLKLQIRSSNAKKKRANRVGLSNPGLILKIQGFTSSTLNTKFLRSKNGYPRNTRTEKLVLNIPRMTSDENIFDDFDDQSHR